MVEKRLSIIVLLISLQFFHSHCLINDNNRDIYTVISRFDDEPEESAEYDSESGTPYKNCGGSKSELLSVEIVPCKVKVSGHCVVSRGTNVTFRMSFISEEYTKALTVKLYGLIDYIPVPFPFPQPNACKNSGIVCPIVKGQVYNYTASAPVKSKYPKASLWLKGELRDDNGNNLVCIEIPVKLV